MRNMLKSLTLVVLACPLVVGAQTRGPIDKGSMLVGGTASISRTSVEFEDEDFSATGISIAPTILYFVAPRVAIGGQLGLSWVDFEDGNSSSWLLGPAARLYFGEVTAKTLPYVGASVSVGGSDNNGSNSTWGLEGVAGLTWMVSRQVGITGEAYLGRTELENDNDFGGGEQTRTDIGIRFGFAAFLFGR